MLRGKHILLACSAVLILLLCSAARIKAKNTSSCVSSSCGDISISYPFRLRGDPPNCGVPDPIFLLECHQNRTVVRSESRRYHVEAINYSGFSARISDPGLDSHNYSSCPVYYSSDSSFWSSYISVDYSNHVDIAFLNCLKPVDNPLYVESPFCGNTSALSNASGVYRYATAGRILVSDLEESCTYDAMTEASFPSPLKGIVNYTYAQLHDLMSYGIELSWQRVLCRECEESRRTCILEKNNQIRCHRYCYEDTPLSELNFKCKIEYYAVFIYLGVLSIGSFFGLRFLLGLLFLIGLVIHKYRKEKSSADNGESIEELLRQQTHLMPIINYSYREIKRMTGKFKVKLGEGTHGTVYKGKLRSGPPVAVKMLTNHSVSDRDFINHILTLGKTNHPNVVKLIGFCIEGKKRALVHEFVQCRSMESMASSLTCEQMFRVCLGIAHGIQCLDSIQTCHLGIKPCNILLDQDFNPKISDSGLYSLHELRVKGTGGKEFIAPEMFYKNIREVSIKADVYSFGMLVLEMAAKLQFLISDNKAFTYFPQWIYKQLSEGKEMGTRDGDSEEKMMMMMKKMVLTGLCCIQIRPEDRPLMNEVVGMLEGDIETLHIPPNPFRTAIDNEM